MNGNCKEEPETNLKEPLSFRPLTMPGRYTQNLLDELITQLVDVRNALQGQMLADALSAQFMLRRVEVDGFTGWRID